VEIVEVDGGEYAVLVHRGPYEKLGEVYGWLYGVWLAQSGRQPDQRPSIEIYLNNCAENPPEELRTEIRIPLATAGS
ncbi:MAG: GyrI-like domain-containing protein, partial [Planctomycetota bacterium]